MPSHRYPKSCYLILKGQDDIGRNNWVTSLYKYGFGCVWLFQDVGNQSLFLLTFKICIHYLITHIIRRIETECNAFFQCF